MTDKQVNKVRIFSQQMEECKFILPLMDNTNKNLVGQHIELTRDLLKAFGGYTVTVGKGVWLDDTGEPVRDEVKIYTVAAGFHTNVNKQGAALPPSIKASKDAASTNDYLRQLAADYCVRANVDAIYITVRGGKVEIVGVEQ